MDGTEASIMQGLWVFGGGRRVCVEYKLAQTQQFVAFARLLYSSDYAPVSLAHAIFSCDADNDRLASTTA